MIKKKKIVTRFIREIFRSRKKKKTPVVAGITMRIFFVKYTLSTEVVLTDSQNCKKTGQGSLPPRLAAREALKRPVTFVSFDSDTELFNPFWLASAQ